MPDTANADSQRALSEAREAWEVAHKRAFTCACPEAIACYDCTRAADDTATAYIAALEADLDAALARVGELEQACGDLAENVKRWQNKEASVRKRFRKSQARIATLEATAREVAGELREWKVVAEVRGGKPVLGPNHAAIALANRLNGESDG